MSGRLAHTYLGTDRRRRSIGWIWVVLIHLLALWGLVSGTARQGLEILKKPLEAAVIQEVIIPPPPPPPPPKQIKQPEPQAPVAQAPPPPFVPPPEVAAPATTAPVIAASPVAPATPPVIAPPPPPAPAAPPRPAQIGVLCPNQVAPVMPRRAIQAGIGGVVRAQATIREGVVKEVAILSGPRELHSAVRDAMLQYRCVSDAAEIRAVQEFDFKID